MTTAQQQAIRALKVAEHAYLEAYGWKRGSSGGWTHPRRDYLVIPCTTHDAMEQTRADPTLGWPV